MMDYKEMAEIVTKEVDAILERKRIRAMRIKRVSLTASGLCAAVLVSFGVWKLRPSLENKNNFDDTNIVITTVTTAETTETTTQTTSRFTAAKTEKTTSSAKTTVTTANTSKAASTSKTTTAKATAAVTIRTSAHRTTSLPVTTRKITTTTVALTTVSLPVSTTVTAAQTSTTVKVHVTTLSPTTGAFVVTTAPVTSTTTPPGGITDPPPNKNTMTEIFLASTATVEIKKNGTYVDYEKHNTLIEPENIGDFISLVSLKMVHPDGTRQIMSMGVYTIKDVDMEEAVALRLVNEYSFTEGYYLFTDPNYKKNDN
ncbi:hypothetical protein [Ruminococcus flavefaciens]|uniref:hypothetical protein n=1 Tax=Ruminococcus flavefaciens TaxID=1265 RepID=UPI00048CB344|nr:hypothetical protein [Ruminococcus flavefaciens]